MPDAYISAPVVTDEMMLYQGAIARVQQDYPNWAPAPGSSIDIVLRIGAGMAAIAAENASSVSTDIMRYFGTLAGKPPYLATPASAMVQFTVQDINGYTIPLQTPVGLTAIGVPQAIGFATKAEIDIPPGSTTGSGLIVAIDPDSGASGNNLSTIVRTDSLSFVTGITLTAGPSQNGNDPETTSDYLDRLVREFQLWTTTPLLGKQFALAASSVVPGIYRATALDNYNPATGTSNNDKYVTTCPIDVNGNAVSSGVKSLLTAYYNSVMLTGFVGPIVDPNYSTINVAYTAHSSPANPTATVISQISAALATLLSPATWGMPNPSNAVPIWNNTPVLRFNKVVQAIENCPLVDWAGPVTIAIAGNSLAAADITMPGAFPLPNLGTVTPTIVTS